MSRHRNVRNLQYDDFGDDDDEYDAATPSSYDHSPSMQHYLFDRTKYTLDRSMGDYVAADEEDEDSALLDVHIPAVLSAVEGVTREEATSSLRYNNYDLDKTVNYLLDKKASSRSPSTLASDGQFDIELEEEPLSAVKGTKKGGKVGVDGDKGEDDRVLEARKGAFKQPKKKEKEEEVHVSAATAQMEQMSIQEGLKTPTKIKKTNALRDSNSEVLLKSPAVERAPKNVKQMSAGRRTEIESMIQAKSKEKEHLNLVVIGHVDAGKSTIMGHLLYLLGFVSKKVMHKYEKDSKNIGKGSFSFAWVLDEHDEERSRGITMDVGITDFETSTKKITLLDAPGHKDFVPNMISGASQADVALLIVDASVNEFERGFEEGGQTKEHALLARSLGVTQLGVVVNKLDNVDWSQERFDEVSGKLKAFLKQSGFREKNLWFLPASGLAGENIIERKDPLLSAWYSGPTLLERIEKFEAAPRDTSKPFRLSVSDSYKGQHFGPAVAGKIEAGFVTVGDKLLFMPLNEVCTVKAIRAHNEPVDYAEAGQNVDIAIVGVDLAAFGIGDVLCDPESPIPITNRFRAQLITFTLQRPIIKGHTAEFHYQSLNQPCNITSLLTTLDKTTGEVKKRKPRALGDSVTAVVEIRTLHSLCLELYSNYRQLGRFTLREGGKTIAAGIITELL